MHLASPSDECADRTLPHSFHRRAEQGSNRAYGREATDGEMTRNDMYPVPMGLVSADTSKRRILGGNIAQSRIPLEFARPDTGSTDPPPERAACGYIGWGPQRVAVEAGTSERCALGSGVVQTLRAGWRVGRMNTWIDRCSEWRGGSIAGELGRVGSSFSQTRLIWVGASSRADSVD